MLRHGPQGSSKKLREEMPDSTMDRPERAGTEIEVENSHEALRNLAARLQSAREEERTTLARELHDDLGQVLTAMKLDLAWLERRIKNQRPPCIQDEALGKFKELESLVDGAIATVQRISSDLRPAVLDLLGLWPALENEIYHFMSRTGIKCVLHPCDITQKACDRNVPLAIFRIVQEALTNVARHSKATAVDISFTASKGGYVLTLADNGRGIAWTDSDDPYALGLIGMRERARTFDGKFTIARTSEEGGGTTISVSIPAKVFGDSK